MKIWKLVTLASLINSEPEPKRGRKFREFSRPRITLEPLDKIADRDETSK